MSNPQPRPALKNGPAKSGPLKKAPDAKVHPAAPELKPARIKEELKAGKALNPLRKGATSDHLRPKGKKSSDKPKEDLVVLEVRLPKKLQKQLKQRAKDARLSTDEAVTRLIQIWLDT